MAEALAGSAAARQCLRMSGTADNPEPSDTGRKDGRRDDHVDDRGEPDSRRAAVAGLIVIVLLVIGGYYLATALRENGRLQDCFASGRTNCAPIDVKGK